VASEQTNKNEQSVVPNVDSQTGVIGQYLQNFIDKPLTDPRQQIMPKPENRYES